MVVAPFHMKDIEHVEILRRNVDHDGRALEAFAPDQIGTRHAHGVKTGSLGPERGSAVLAPDGVGAVDDHGVVCGAHGIPARAGRAPSAELHGRIPEFGEEVESFGEEPEVHGVGVAMGAARIVIQPQHAAFTHQELSFHVAQRSNTIEMLSMSPTRSAGPSRWV